MMSDSPNIIRKCSVTMMMSLYSDVINIVAGALLNFAHIYGILLSIGYIILHLVSIGYLLFYRKLGFRYHLKTSRILILFPQIFLLIIRLFGLAKDLIMVLTLPAMFLVLPEYVSLWVLQCL